MRINYQSDTCVGFLLGGIGEVNEERQSNFMVVEKDTSAAAIDECFKRFVAREDIAIIMINQIYADMIRATIDKHLLPVPTVLEIPSKQQPYDVNKDSILKRAHRNLRGTKSYRQNIKIHLFFEKRALSSKLSTEDHSDSELVNIFKFLQRAVETFGRNHGLQLALPKETGARVLDEAESRGHRKKKKWLIILPLIILMKIAHLKMTLVTLLLGVLGMNVLLVGGTGWLIHYLKYKTLCKIHPHLVQSHSHVYDSDPSDYSQFLGSSYSNGFAGYSPSSPHEVNANGYSKDWATSKAYHGHNYLDTISKRVQ
ncbi:uncharacterized protein Osi1 isoform X3 [Drosophila virilis]|uniref:uncharacterized protein Osi1 isoform X3 n=1 Tax=Drosophila virilis TaxID=7244 RepID=UPI0038B36EAF